MLYNIIHNYLLANDFIISRNTQELPANYFVLTFNMLANYFCITNSKYHEI